MGSHFQVKELEGIHSTKIDANNSGLPIAALSSIREMAETFGVTIRALRFYEDRGLLHPQRHGGVRHYGELDKKHLSLILKGKQLGFTLSEIHDMIDSAVEDMEHAEHELRLQPQQIAAQIDHLERQRNDIDIAIQALRDAQQKKMDKSITAKSC